MLFILFDFDSYIFFIRLADLADGQVKCEMGGGPAEILPPKKQAVVDRLRRRIESYRRHQNDCVPRFDHSFNGVVEQNVQDTLLLKQRFLENKAKRTVKKSEKKPADGSLQSTSTSLPKYATKRSASEDVESNGSDNFIGSSVTAGGVIDGPPSKSSPATVGHKEGLTKFSVEIVQQLEFTTSTANSQISANVTVKAMNTCIKSDPASSPPSSPTRQPNTPHQVIECKREPELKFVDLEECAAALEKDAAALHGNTSFPGFTDLMGDDASVAFNDLISDISDFNTEFMRDFDFDNSENKNSVITSSGNGGGNDGPAQNANQQSRQQRVDESSLHHIKTEAKEVSHLHPSCSQARIPYNTGLEIGKAELSPAAQTLKQMAEQHQVKVAALGIGYGGRLHNFGVAGAQAASGNPYPQELKQEAYSNAGQSQSGQNGQGRSQGSPGPQGQARAGSPGGPRYKTSFGNFTGRQGQQRAASGPLSLHASQTQQLHSQGHHVQVSLAQSMSAELKGTGAMTLGAQQASYMGNSPAQDTYCSVSQSQTLNFSQQNLRTRTTPAARHAHHNVGVHHPVVMEIINQSQSPHLVSRQEFANKSHAVQHPLVRFPQSRMLPLQPMPASGPLLRVPHIGGTGATRLSSASQTAKSVREMNPTHNDALAWKQMLLHQSRTSAQFQQAQGVAYSTNDAQNNGSQVQHVSIPHQNLALHQVNPTMSVRIHMTQNMSSNPGFTTSGGKPTNPTSAEDHTGIGQNYPPTSTFSAANTAVVYTQPAAYQAQHQTLQNSAATQHSAGSIPSEFNLDFLEQLPADSGAHFTDQDLINSLESTASFNFQDIL